MIFQLNNQKGYVALISTIVISVLLITITLSLGFSSFFGRFDILDSESKERSMALAEACVDSAILNLANDPSYNPNNECKSVGDSCPNGPNVCTIVSITDLGINKVIKTQADINKSFTNLKVIVDSVTFDVVSWKECANLDGSC